MWGFHRICLDLDCLVGEGGLCVQDPDPMRETQWNPHNKVLQNNVLGHKMKVGEDIHVDKVMDFMG